MELPKVEVRFQHLFVNADVYFGARALPTLFNFARNAFEVVRTHTHILQKSWRFQNIFSLKCEDFFGIFFPESSLDHVAREFVFLAKWLNFRHKKNHWIRIGL